MQLDKRNERGRVPRGLAVVQCFAHLPDGRSDGEIVRCSGQRLRRYTESVRDASHFAASACSPSPAFLAIPSQVPALSKASRPMRSVTGGNQFRICTALSFLCWPVRRQRLCTAHRQKNCSRPLAIAAVRAAAAAAWVPIYVERGRGGTQNNLWLHPPSVPNPTTSQ